MGFEDKLKDLTKKAQDAAAEHKDQLLDAVVKAQQTADQQTGGKYHEKIAKVGAKAQAYVENLKPADDGQDGEPPARPGS